MNGNLIGQILEKQFRVDEFIASGGMAAVYRVWDLRRNAPLAMKVLHSDLADDPAILKRFQREARALRKLAHPNIVPFYGLYQVNEFSFLLENIDTTKGNLSFQLSKLKDAGYIQIKKSFRNNYPLTTLKITEEGINAYENYVEAISDYFKNLNKE